MLTDEDFLTALYVGLLARPPDPDGLAQHKAHLEGSRSDTARYARMAAAFAASPEFQLARQLRSVQVAPNLYLPDLSGVTFDHGVSLGSFCHTAMALKRAGIRRSAAPFDWLFSRPDMVASCIEDDFARFLDPHEYIPVPLEDRQSPNINLCHHAGFRDEFGVSFVFNHHKPYEADDYAYFERCVRRFRDILTSSGWVLFFIVLHPTFDETKLQRLLSALRSRRAEGFVLIGLKFKVPSGGAVMALEHRISTKRPERDLLMVDLGLSGPSDGTTFRHPHDNLLLDRVLKSFRFRS